jgi:hypothetical protein
MEIGRKIVKVEKKTPKEEVVSETSNINTSHSEPDRQQPRKLTSPTSTTTRGSSFLSPPLSVSLPAFYTFTV